MDPYRLAVHEAGHAIAIIRTGGRFRLVTTVTSFAPSSGDVVLSWDGVVGPTGGDEAMKVALVAGMAAEVLAFDGEYVASMRALNLEALPQEERCARWLPSRHESDFANYCKLTGKGAIELEHARAAVRLLSDNWDDVARLASGLNAPEGRSLTFDAVVEIVGEARI